MSRPLAQTLMVQVKYAVSGNRLSTIFCYSNDSGPLGILAAKLLAEDFIAHIFGPLKAALSQDVHFQEIYCWCPAPNTINPWSIPQEDQIGGVATDSLPSNLPAIIRLMQVEVGGRHNGRLCLSGVAEGDVTDSYITDAAYSDHWAPLLTALTAPLSAGGSFDLSVLQRFSGGLAITPVAHFINQRILNRAVGSMRRRTTELREIHP